MSYDLRPCLYSSLICAVGGTIVYNDNLMFISHIFYRINYLFDIFCLIKSGYNYTHFIHIYLLILPGQFILLNGLYLYAASIFYIFKNYIYRRYYEYR